MSALIHNGEVLETLEVDYLVCVDSKIVEELFLKAQMGYFKFSLEDQSFKDLIVRCKSMKICLVKRQWNQSADRLAKEVRNRERLVVGWL